MAAHKLFIDYAIDRKDAFEQTQKVLDMLERTNKLLKKQDEDKIAMDLKFELTRKELQILKEKASSQEKEALKLKEIVQSQEKKVQSQEKELQILKEQVQKLQEKSDSQEVEIQDLKTIHLWDEDLLFLGEFVKIIEQKFFKKFQSLDWNGISKFKNLPKNEKAETQFFLIMKKEFNYVIEDRDAFFECVRKLNKGRNKTAHTPFQVLCKATNEDIMEKAMRTKIFSEKEIAPWILLKELML